MYHVAYMSQNRAYGLAQRSCQWRRGFAQRLVGDTATGLQHVPDGILGGGMAIEPASLLM